MCQILDQNQQTNEKIVVFSRDIAALKLIKRDFSTSSLFFDMKKWIFFCISIFSKMFSLVVTLFQKYRKLTEYIHNLGIAPPLFEICPRVGFCLKFTPDFFFFASDSGLNTRDWS